MVRPCFAEAALSCRGRWHDCRMAKKKWIVKDGPLEGEVFALDEEGGQFSITLADNRVAVYQARVGGELHFVGIDPFA